MAGQLVNDTYLSESPRILTNIFYEDGGNSSQQRSVSEDELYGRPYVKWIKPVYTLDT